MSDFETPEDLRYTEEHEWVKRTGPTTVRVGITDYAQSQLGDVVFVQLPAVDDEVAAGDSFGEVESTKSVSDIYAPMSAKVIAVNEDLEAGPEAVNSDPYGAGWLVDLEVADEKTLDTALSDTLGAQDYLSVIGS
ncbi:glycine cleavage system protein GcvH [Antrihabitans sp. YC2-6]|uniref:glycine cleavage system protein GcvH n=1 Tax=Antrihabitans sp. YC2-6 TaxID=2799498 RepID=UPI0018F5FB29|nr:glycine cleavage system protein GcvH [Antrihabitans sp. YC2-6]MBJ8348514.1 glycine cleavage system protein GcvH [Antrihabitans sp. YC2-6]